jgi:proteasome assembly chaperone (PAC2) family protein
MRRFIGLRELVSLWKQFLVENGNEKRVYTHNPLLVISLSTSNPQYILLYSQARELGTYLLNKMKFEKIASFYSSSLPPAIQISKKGTLDLAGVEFYHHFNGKRDVILLLGHSSPMGDEYEFSDQVLSFAQKIGVREMVSIGARWSEEPIPPLETPKVIGFSSDEDGVEELKALGVEIQKDESAYFFANTVVGLANKYAMRGFKLSVNHGEPRPHPKSIISILGVLSKMMREEVDTADLQNSAQELEKAIRTAGYDSSTSSALGSTQQQSGMYR